MTNETASLHDSAVEVEKMEPCEHMTEYLSALSDGSLHGPAAWFTRLHVLYCRKCGPALRGFQHLRDHLHVLRDEPKTTENLAPETRAALRQTLDDMDAKDK